MNMPAEVGGGGLSMVDICLVEEELGKTSDALIRRIFGQVYPMLMACRGEQRERYLIADGEGRSDLRDGDHRARCRLGRRLDQHDRAHGRQ